MILRGRLLLLMMTDVSYCNYEYLIEDAAARAWRQGEQKADVT